MAFLASDRSPGELLRASRGVGILHTAGLFSGLGGAALQLVFYECEAPLKLREPLVEVGESSADIRMECVQQSDDAHHSERNVLREFSILEVLLDHRANCPGVETPPQKLTI
jgi:hypothetical protein